MMLKVTHVIYLAEVPRRNVVSGAENQILLLVRELARAGLDVRLVVMLWSDGPSPNIDSLLDEIRRDGVDLVIIRRTVAHDPLRKWYFIGRCLRELLMELRSDPERIVHLHLDLRFTVLVARLARCRNILITIHCDDPVYATWHYWCWLRAIDGGIWRYVAITDHVREHFVKVAGIAPNKIRTIYYGLHPPARRTLEREEFDLPTDAFVVGYVGRLTEQKNLDQLIRASGKLPADVICVFIGDGELRHPLEELTRECGANVRFWGSIPQAWTLMPLFDLFCLPSIFEGLGLVLVEAMLQQVPILGSRRSAITEILGEGRYGRLCEPDADSIAAAITKARSEQEQMRGLAQVAYEHAQSAFAVQRMVAETIELYESAPR